jgi:hypothetical protein
VVNRKFPSRQAKAIGAYNVQCDRCGNWYRHYDCKLEWTGLFVCTGCWEPRNDQDFVRGIADDLVPEIPRPKYGLPTVIITYPIAISDLAIADQAVADDDGQSMYDF